MELLELIVFLALIVIVTKMANDAKILSENPSKIEKFDTDEFYPALRSFGRTAHLNEAVNNALCNPHGQFYILRYSKPSTFIGKVYHTPYPMTMGYYNACAEKI